MSSVKLYRNHSSTNIRVKTAYHRKVRLEAAAWSSFYIWEWCHQGHQHRKHHACPAMFQHEQSTSSRQLHTRLPWHCCTINHAEKIFRINFTTVSSYNKSNQEHKRHQGYYSITRWWVSIYSIIKWPSPNVQKSEKLTVGPPADSDQHRRLARLVDVC